MLEPFRAELAVGLGIVLAGLSDSVALADRTDREDVLMDGLDMTQRRLEAVAELAAQEATRHGLGDREARWVM